MPPRLHTAVPVLLAVFALAAVASAAPVRAPRANAAAFRRGLPWTASLDDPRAGVPIGACGTRLDEQPERLGEWMGRTLIEPLPTTFTRDIGEIAVLEDDGTLFYTNSGNQPLLDLARAIQAFYRDHPDQYDAIAFYLASGQNQWLGSPGALAASWLIRNSTEGIGLGQFDYGTAMGAPPGLHVALTMNGLHRYPSDLDAPIGGPEDTFSTMDVLAHEFAHRWLAYTFVDSLGTLSAALLGRDFQHWGFFADVDGSYMEGCDWTQVGPDSFRTTAVSERFGVLDQYLMGLRTRAEIDSFFVVNAPTQFDPDGTYIPITTPFVGLGCDGQATYWKVSDIEAANGPRVPDGATAPRNFHMAFVLITPHGSAASPADLAKLEAIRQRFPLTLSASTEGRASIDVSLEALPETLEIIHARVSDAESEPVARTLVATARARRGPPDAAVTRMELLWRAGGAGAFTVLPMTPMGGDSFSVTLPIVAGGDAEYYLQATDDGYALSAVSPPAGASAPWSYFIGPDLTPPSVVHTPVPAQSRDRMPQILLAKVTDALGVDSVWCEYRIGSGALQQLGAARVGRDSFTVSLGGGTAVGTVIAYRFVARDRALAANLASSSPGFDTLRVVRDWIDDFENPTTFFHYNVLYSWRDLWHVSEGASSPFGEFAWHSGSVDGTAYPAHVDGALYSPILPALGPGVTLSFDHRYELESYDGVSAWDGARVEISVNNGPWQVAMPQAGYSHVMIGRNMPFAQQSPCWSGSALEWRTEQIDLSAFDPGPIRFRFRMCADDMVGAAGWWVDRLRVHFPDNTTVDVPIGPAAMALGATWPNPAHEHLHQSVQLARDSDLEWTLLDVTGRRIRVLATGSFSAGEHQLSASLPRGLAGGIYFARLSVAGRTVTTRRIAILE